MTITTFCVQLCDAPPMIYAVMWYIIKAKCDAEILTSGDIESGKSEDFEAYPHNQKYSLIR